MNKRTLFLAFLSLPALACSGLFPEEEEISTDGEDGTWEEEDWEPDLDVSAQESEGVIVIEVVVDGADSGSFSLFDGAEERYSGALEEGASGRWFGEYELGGEYQPGSYDYEINMQFPDGEVTQTGTVW